MNARQLLSQAANTLLGDQNYVCLPSASNATAAYQQIEVSMTCVASASYLKPDHAERTLDSKKLQLTVNAGVLQTLRCCISVVERIRRGTIKRTGSLQVIIARRTVFEHEHVYARSERCLMIAESRMPRRNLVSPVHFTA